MTTTAMDIRQKELPAGWKWVKLGDVCREIKTTDPKKEPEQIFSYVDISSVSNISKRIVEPKNILGQDAPSRAKRVIQTNDVLLSTTRPNLNAVALVSSELDGQVCSTGFCVLRADDSLDEQYLFNFTKSHEFIQSLSGLVVGALYPAITDKQVFAQFIPLPPLEEQKRISRILNELMAAVDKAKKAAQERLEVARVLMDAYLREALPYHQGKVPDGWRWVKVKDLIESALNGLYKPDMFYGSGTPILKMFNIGRLDGTWSLDRLDLIELTDDELDKFRVRSGDVILNRVNSAELVGKSAVVDTDTEGSVFEAMNMRLRLNPSANSKFVVAYLNSKEARHQIATKLKKIIGQASVNQQDVCSLTIPLPPIEEQKRIASDLDAKRTGTRLVEELIRQELDTLEAVSAALLRRAFSGGLQ